MLAFICEGSYSCAFDVIDVIVIGANLAIQGHWRLQI